MTSVPLDGDILLNDLSLLSNSTFDMDALNRTMEYLAITNYWNLYRAQRVKMNVQRFDIPFSDFVLETRLPGQTNVKYYPKRYVHYVDYTFIQTRYRERYRRSDCYLKELDQQMISVNPKIFPQNFLLFIGNELITTCEIYPWEDKLCIIIDVATSSHVHGIPQEKYIQYHSSNPMVSIYIVPNYTVQVINTTVNTIKSYDHIVPINRIRSNPTVTPDTVFFMNTTPDKTALTLIDDMYYDEESQAIYTTNLNMLDDSTSEITLYCYDFPNMSIYEIDSDNSYLEINNLMPSPIENMILFTKNTQTGKTVYDHEIKTELFYPNIYRFSNRSSGENCLTFLWYNDDNLSDNERYKDELDIYRKYVDLYNKYRFGKIPDIVKNYKPSIFTYNEREYEDSIYVPYIINYKVAKLREYISIHPEALKIYWNMLGTPSEKYYLDMTKFNLSERERMDTYDEDPELETNIEFDEPHYMFRMRREFGMGIEYTFRIFIDGLFLHINQYKILTGLDFYYIYIPTSNISDTSLIEIERFRNYVSTNTGEVSSNEEYIELVLPENTIVQARDIYLYDTKTKLFLTELQYTLMHMSVYINSWVDIPVDGAYCVSGETIRIFIKDPTLYGKILGYGVHQSSYMETGEVFHVANENPEFFGNPYTKVDVINYGNYSETSYRLFNKGRFCLPEQFYVRSTKYFGGIESIRTKCIVKDGDQFTVDHVPGTYRTVLYIEEIGESGYLDLDGKIPLPLSFKWYDIYLNGVRLNRNMIDFISETKCYIHDVGSRRNFIIMERNHDDDMFYLTSFAYKQSGYCTSVIDRLMTLCKDVKDEIDSHYNIIENTDSDIIEGGILSREALINLIIFTEYFTYVRFDANRDASALFANVRKEFPEFTDIYHSISGNVSPTGKFIKRINPNELIK